MPHSLARPGHACRCEGCVPTWSAIRLVRFAQTRQGQLLEIVSYAIPGGDNRTGAAISHFIIGHSQRKGENGHERDYRYPGFIEKDGVVWIGQSVFMLTPGWSVELRRYLESCHVAYGRVAVRIT